MSYKRMRWTLALLLAAGPLSAQTRLGAIAEAGTSGVSGVSVNGALQAPSAPSLAPALTAASLSASPIAAAPAAVQPAAAAAAVPAAAQLQAQGVRAALEELAPEKLGKLSGESAKSLSGRLLGLEEGRVESADAVSGLFAASAPDLEPYSESRGEAAREPRAPEPSRSSRPTAADLFHHARLLAQNYYWYSVTHIIDMWPGYQRRYEEAKAKGAANVSRPRAFFAHMRIASGSGRFYVLGAAPLEDDAVIASFRRDLLRWFDAPGVIGPKELAAFDAFTARAKHYNAERRAPSNMRKHIRDALLKASTMEPSKLAGFFDSLLLDETARETSDFQNKGAQKRILDAFKGVVLDTLAEEPEGVRGRIRAAILLGSFATGSAGPKSDFDVELLTDGGSNARSADFIKRLTDRWIATGRHAANPVTVHDFPSTPTRGIIDLVHTGDYIVISLDEELAERLQRKPGEYAPTMVRADSLRGKVNRAVQYGVIVASTYIGQLKARFGAASSHR